MSTHKSYPVYKDSGTEILGLVPKHWEILRAKTLIDSAQNGIWGDDPDGSDDDVHCARVADFDRNNLTVEGPLPTLRNVPESQRLTRQVYAGDLLIEKSGGGEQTTVGVVVQYRGREPVICSNFVAVIKPKPEVQSRWLCYTFAYLYSMGVNTRSIKQTTGIQNIDASQYFSEQVAVPPQFERELIAEYLDRETVKIDTLVRKKTRFIDLLREKRQALVTHAVTKGFTSSVKMKNSGVEWLGVVPDHWDVLQLRHTARLESGHTPSRSKPEYWVDCTIPWFTLADVWQVRSGEQKYVSETAEKVSQLGLENSSARLLPAGSVFLSRTASVGFAGIMEVDMATSQDFAVWTCGSELFNEYLYYVLLGMKPDFDRLMMGSTHKTIYMPDIEAIRIARPPFEEQRAIVEALSGQLGRFRALIDKTERSIALLKERRTALITAAVTGQIDLRETV